MGETVFIITGVLIYVAGFLLGRKDGLEIGRQREVERAQRERDEANRRAWEQVLRSQIAQDGLVNEEQVEWPKEI